MSCGEGAQGERLYDWAYVPLRPGLERGWVHALVIRRDLSDADELAYYLVFAPTDTPLAEIVRAIGSRWTIEDVFKLAKRQVGLDQYEARSWTGWHRHVTLALLALAALVLGAAKGGTPPADPDLVPVSIPELRRLMIRLRPDHPHPARFVLAWSRWRRHHQAVARDCHIKRRRRALDPKRSL